MLSLHTLIISTTFWCRGAKIGWHSDDNRLYLKQRDFSVGLHSFLCVVLELRFYVNDLVFYFGLKAVCYLISYAKDFKGGLFRFSGEPATVAPSAGVSVFFFSWISG
ncbi:hypothetical protein HA466_0322520 [Hirschfeldia incana]|nr:hypothetical protein HA466_0322520 [Hirschfeldia incana]